ncbi:CLIP-associating protein 2 [Sarcophilus harrisii]|nr:CLIP-associating protein 2 [Sarcophilus harrisii]
MEAPGDGGGSGEPGGPSLSELCALLLRTRDAGSRLQAGHEVLRRLRAPGPGAGAEGLELELDEAELSRVVDELTAWLPASHSKVALLGLEILSAFVDRLSTRFKSYVPTVISALLDRLGDSKDQVREQAQSLILKLTEQAASPMYVWEHLTAGFKHKNYRSREGVCLCLIATLNIYGAQALVLSKLVPYLCVLLGDSNGQVRDAAVLAMVEIYRHAGERVRADLAKRGLPAARLQTVFARFDEVRDAGAMILSIVNDKSFDDEESVDGNRPSTASSAFKVPAPKTSGNPVNSGRKPGSSGGPKAAGASKEGGAGAVDEDDFVKAFAEVPSVQIYSSRELEETLNKIREILSDDKHDWDQRANALKKVRSLLLAGAAQYDCFFQHLRLLDGALKLSAKDLRSQVVREACITVAHLSTVLGNKFDHGAEAIVPTLFNLVPNSAKVMATSGCAAIRFIIRHTHVPRLIPLITSNCSSKSVAVRRRSFEFLDLLLQEWQTHSLERHAAVLVETIKKGIHDADAEARVEARKTYMGLRNHFPGEAETLYNSLEPSYQRSLQTYLKNSGSAASLPPSDRSSSSSQESLNRPFSSKWSAGSASAGPGRVSSSSGKMTGSPGSLQRSHSDIDVNTAAGAKARHIAGQAGGGRLGPGTLTPGSYASLEDASEKADGAASDDGRVRAKLSTAVASAASSKADSRGRSRTKMVSQSQRSSSPDKMEDPAATVPCFWFELQAGTSAATSSQEGGGREDHVLSASWVRGLAISGQTAPLGRSPPPRFPLFPPPGRLQPSPANPMGGKNPRCGACLRPPIHISGQALFSRSVSPAGGSWSWRFRDTAASPVAGESRRPMGGPAGGSMCGEHFLLLCGFWQSWGAASVKAPGGSGPPRPHPRSAARLASPSLRGPSHRLPVRPRAWARGRLARAPPLSPGGNRQALCGPVIPASRHHSRSTGALYTPDVCGASGAGYGIGQSSRLSSSVSAMRVLNTGSDVEEAVADALLLGDMRTKKKPARRRYELYGGGMYSDDDANSDASSACSERSYSSRNGSIPTYMRQTEDVAEVLNRCASSNWSERKEGLLGLQSLLKSQRTLSRVELKRLCEIFTRMFADPHSKRVFSMFLETLVDFLQVHKDDLQDWLFVLLTQLLKKMGADLLGSVQAKVQKALDITRESFPNDLQFNILMRFTVDQTQTPSLKAVQPTLRDQLRSSPGSSKVKVAILKYIETLAQQMDPGDFVNSSETRLAVSRIITWTTEPKSSDVRKAAQAVLISLFELNTREGFHWDRLAGTSLRHGPVRTPPPLVRPAFPARVMARPPGCRALVWSALSHGNRTRSRSSPGRGTEAMPEFRAHRGFRPGAKAAVQGRRARRLGQGLGTHVELTLRRHRQGLLAPAHQMGTLHPQPGGTQRALKRESKREGEAEQMGSDPRAGGDAPDPGRGVLDNKTSMLNTMPPHSSPRARDYNPYNYSDGGGSFNKSALKEAMFDDDAEQFPDDLSLDHSDLVAELLKELSNHNERAEERKGALCELLKLTQEDAFGVWDEHFKTILLLLLETLGDREHSVRALALRVLREILRNQPARFKNYAELTIMKTLEAHKDPHKEVVRSAEEAASMLATSISPEQCIKVLCPIIQTADYPINLAAIKMQTKVIERVSKETLAQLLPEIVPGLIQGYDNSESSVRKACVFCLVAIHAVIGDELKPHLSQLTGSKMKLLNLYIKRAQTGSGGSDPAAVADGPGQS